MDTCDPYSGALHLLRKTQNPGFDKELQIYKP